MFLGRETIYALVRDEMTEEDATTVSLVENVHRADMNPRDKARAFKRLQDQVGKHPVRVPDDRCRRRHIAAVSPAP